MDFCRQQPCNNCPYRTDAPLKLWHVAEFQKLLDKEDDMLGAVYGCHKKDGHVCVGWLMKQDEHNFPSIMLRIELSKKKVDRTYLDNLTSKVPLYNTVKEMCVANYPEVFDN